MTINDKLLALVDSLLVSAHMQRVDTVSAQSLWGVYEDEHAVVGVAAFESIDELVASWMDAQERLADLMSQSVTNIGAKAWDGYLILVCSQTPLGDEIPQLSGIRSNTRRTRKILVIEDDPLVAASEDLTEQRRRVRRALAPLMPLHLPAVNKFVDPLDELPTRVQVTGFNPEDLRALVASYERREPLVATLHARLEGDPS